MEALEGAETLDPAVLETLLSPSLLLFLGYALLLVSLAVAGLVLFCLRVRRLNFLPTERELPRQDRWKTAFLNPGMLLFLAACIILTVTQAVWF